MKEASHVLQHVCAIKGTFPCAQDEISRETALGLIAAAQILLDVAEDSPCGMRHPFFSGAHSIFVSLSFERRVRESSGADWEEVRRQLEALGRRLGVRRAT